MATASTSLKTLRQEAADCPACPLSKGATQTLRGRMAKAGTPKKKKAKPKLTDKEQSERFKQTARDLGVDESGEAFEKTFKKIAHSAK